MTEGSVGVPPDAVFLSNFPCQWRVRRKIESQSCCKGDPSSLRFASLRFVRIRFCWKAGLFQQNLMRYQWQEHPHLLQCFNNFMRYHWSLKMGSNEITPAMEAKIANQKISLRDTFLCSRFFNISELTHTLIKIWGHQKKNRKQTCVGANRVGNEYKNECDYINCLLAA